LVTPDWERRLKAIQKIATLRPSPAVVTVFPTTSGAVSTLGYLGTSGMPGSL